MTMMQDPLLVSPRYNCVIDKPIDYFNEIYLQLKRYINGNNLQCSRDDPEQVCHHVRDEQVRVDCVAQAA